MQSVCSMVNMYKEIRNILRSILYSLGLNLPQVCEKSIKQWKIVQYWADLTGTPKIYDQDW